MNNLLKSNEQIKISRSAFGAYKNERAIYDGRISPISLDEVLMKVQRRHILPIDFNILEAISSLEFTTSRMVAQYLNLKGMDIKQEKVSDRLTFLNKYKIISRYRFESDEGISYTRVYFLEKFGRILLNSQGFKPNWKPSDSIRPIHIIKQILVRNDISLLYQEKLKNMDEHILSPKLRLVKSLEEFSPHLQVNISNNQKRHTLLFEIVRSYENCHELLVERLQKYQEYFEYFTPSSTIPEIPQLVIVAEIDPHLASIYKIIVKNKLFINKKPMLYTTDLRLIEKPIDEEFMDFKIVKEDNKAKAIVEEQKYSLFNI